MRRGWRWGLVFLLVLLACGGAVYSALGRTELAPPARYVLLDGSVSTEADLRGKVYLVNFWATSCTTCVAEMPKIVDTWRKFNPRGFETVAVAMQYDPPAYVVRFAQTRALPFKIAIDNTGGIAKAWGDIRLTPTTFLVDRQGSIVKRFVGEPDFVELHKNIEKLLTQS